MKNLSIIVPVYNEAENLEDFFSELNSSIAKLNTKYELIAVNDGSTDKSFEILNKIKNRLPNLRIFTFRKNFGKSAAYLVGFTKAQGQYCLTIDSDGQDDPKEFKKLINKLDEGYDAIIGWRKKRSDNYLKKLVSLIWNNTLNLFSGINIHDSNSGLKAFKKAVLAPRYFRGDFHRYLPIILGMDGYKVTEVPVNHRPRAKGKSKYGFTRAFAGVSDFFTTIFLFRFGAKPMHFFGIFGLVVLFLGMIINLYLLFLKLQGISIGGRPILILGLLLTISGLQFIFTGVLGDLLVGLSEFPPSYYLKESRS